MNPCYCCSSPGPSRRGKRCRVKNGHVKRLEDSDVKALVLEVCGTNVATCFLFAPASPKCSLGITMPFMVMIVKNLKRYFSFEVMILDSSNTRRRLRVSNYQSMTRVHLFDTSMPLTLNPGWNQLQFNLADFTKRAYGTGYVETVKVQVHANCRIRRIYFCDRLYPEEDLPREYKFLFPPPTKRELHHDTHMKAPPPASEVSMQDVPVPSDADLETPLYVFPDRVRSLQGEASVRRTFQEETKTPEVGITIHSVNNSDPTVEPTPAPRIAFDINRQIQFIKNILGIKEETDNAELTPLQDTLVIKEEIADTELTSLHDTLVIKEETAETELTPLQDTLVIKEEIADTELTPLQDTLVIKEEIADTELTPLHDTLIIIEETAATELTPLQDALVITEETAETELTSLNDTLVIKEETAETELTPLQDALVIKEETVETELTPLRDTFNVKEETAAELSTHVVVEGTLTLKENTINF